MKKKACQSCKMLFDEESCPACKSQSVSTTWKGRIIVIDAEHSEIAKKLKHEKGEFAIKL